MTTSLTQLLSASTIRAYENPINTNIDVKSPIIVAPMFTASTPELVTAVTGAGAFGLVAAGEITAAHEELFSKFLFVGKDCTLPRK